MPKTCVSATTLDMLPNWERRIQFVIMFYDDATEVLKQNIYEDSYFDTR